MKDNKPVTTKYPVFCRGGDGKQGVWWFRLYGYGIQLKASWNSPLFSESYGHEKYLRLNRWKARWIKP